MFKKIIMLATSIGYAAMLSASPMIAVDKAEFDAGTIKDGSVPELTHVFTISNTGDSTLTITEARPGCGCTVVAFDTTILPGKKGKITAKLSMATIHNGEFNKAVTVASNAANTPSLRLVMKGKVLPIIGMNSSFVQFTKAKPTQEFTLTTQKKDLKISKAYLKISNASVLPEKEARPISMKVTCTKTDTVQADGYILYNVKLEAEVPDSTDKFGDVILMTNHPTQPEASVRGRVTTY